MRSEAQKERTAGTRARGAGRVMWRSASRMVEAPELEWMDSAPNFQLRARNSPWRWYQVL
jgi:hypothetical protein